MALQSSCKGEPGTRIWMAAWKAFLMAFIAQIAAYLQAGEVIWSWEVWKPILVSAFIAALGAGWKVLDIYRESKV